MISYLSKLYVSLWSWSVSGSDFLFVFLYKLNKQNMLIYRFEVLAASFCSQPNRLQSTYCLVCRFESVISALLCQTTVSFD